MIDSVCVCVSVFSSYACGIASTSWLPCFVCLLGVSSSASFRYPLQTRAPVLSPEHTQHHHHHHHHHQCIRAQLCPTINRLHECRSLWLSLLHYLAPSRHIIECVICLPLLILTESVTLFVYPIVSLLATSFFGNSNYLELSLFLLAIKTFFKQTDLFNRIYFTLAEKEKDTLQLTRRTE